MINMWEIICVTYLKRISCLCNKAGRNF